jgi:hypothetical protein
LWEFYADPGGKPPSNSDCRSLTEARVDHFTKDSDSRSRGI